MGNLVYNVNEVPHKAKEWILYTLQMVLSVFVATVLIAQICGTPVSSCLFGAMIGTLIYQLITRFKSPMFISSCGATVSAVLGALALPSALGQNYLMVAIGGAVIFLIYIVFALLIHFKGVDIINKLLPPSIVGAITIVIGLNLATFIPTYTNGSNWVEVLIAIATMFVVAITSHYFKGFLKTIPFLFGIVFGYLVSLAVGIVDFSKFSEIKSIVSLPEFTFLKWNSGDFSWSNLGQTLLLFVPVSVCAVCEHISDHNTLGNIIGTDLKVSPGLDKTLVGDGLASAMGTVTCGLPNTSYGESIATIGFSKVASVWITTASAVFIGLLSFLSPVTAFLQSIPPCVFGGCAMVLYGYIASSGLKTIINNKVDLEDGRNLTIISVVLTVGVSGVFLFSKSFAGVSLAMVLGVMLNLILRNKKEKSN